VVRLPRDWLGPREELVPFGPRASSEGAEESPPSPNDFWGERAASIHDALEAPADGARLAFGAQIRRRFDRRPRATAVGGVAIAVLVVIGILSSVSGPSATRRPAGESKVGVATVFGSGVSRLLHLGLANLDASVPRNLGRRAASETTQRPTVRRGPHRAPAPRIAAHRAHPQVSSTPPVSVDTAHDATAGSSTYAATSHVDTAPTYRSAPPPPPSRPATSPATVSPTGESGALGPIQSPNG